MFKSGKTILDIVMWRNDRFKLKAHKSKAYAISIKKQAGIIGSISDVDQVQLPKLAEFRKKFLDRSENILKLESDRTKNVY